MKEGLFQISPELLSSLQPKPPTLETISSIYQELAGLSAKMIDLPLGIVKFPFMTRVGAGPFPTELGGRASENYCAEDGHTKIDELKHYGIPHQIVGGKIRYNGNDSKIIEMINSGEEFTQGVGIRLSAGEYGATTGRPRRTGWTDVVVAKYAVGINGPLLVLTKPDSLAGAKSLNLLMVINLKTK